MRRDRRGGEVLVAAMQCGDGVEANRARQNHAGKGGQPRGTGLRGGEGGRGNDSVSNAIRTVILGVN